MKRVSQLTKAEKVKLSCEMSAYILVGLGGFSFVSNHANIAYGLTLLAGVIDKFVPRFFGIPAAE